jgi:6-phosphogluconate dehydrogenase
VESLSQKPHSDGNDIGVIGLAVMGRNLVLNMADRGLRVAAYNRTGAVTKEFAADLRPGQRIVPCYSLEEFVASLKRPRAVMLMVKAGGPVDAVIEEVTPLLEAGDIIVDGGNSHFTDTDRRAKALAERRISLLGVGISGGEAGARYGPSLMPGGSSEAYGRVQPILEAIAAKADDGTPCVSYLGSGAVGHYVKMVHNGIEYGIMQLISESYALLKKILGLSNEHLAAVYSDWHQGELESYLIEITARIFRQRDPESGKYLVDLIVAEAEQLGTGTWASQSALDLHVPVPNIDTAVGMRSLSALEGERDSVRELLAPAVGKLRVPGSGLTVDEVRGALIAGVMLTYAQGFALLQAATRAFGYGLKLEDVAGVWRAGCIIRSALLPDIMAIFRGSADLGNLVLDAGYVDRIFARRRDLVEAVKAGAVGGVPLPGFMNALAYLESYRASWWPFNLIQAQRDYFGAHRYRRIDKEGSFHTDWLAPEGEG